MCQMGGLRSNKDFLTQTCIFFPFLFVCFLPSTTLPSTTLMVSLYTCQLVEQKTYSYTIRVPLAMPPSRLPRLQKDTYHQPTYCYSCHYFAMVAITLLRLALLTLTIQRLLPLSWCKEDIPTTVLPVTVVIDVTCNSISMRLLQVFPPGSLSHIPWKWWLPSGHQHAKMGNGSHFPLSLIGFISLF